MHSAGFGTDRKEFAHDGGRKMADEKCEGNGADGAGCRYISGIGADGKVYRC